MNEAEDVIAGHFAKGTTNVYVDKSAVNTAKLPPALQHAALAPPRDLRPLIDRLRCFKSPWEIAAMTEAAHVSSAAFVAAMKATTQDRSVTHEYHLDALLEYKVRMQGAPYLAYPPVVAGGRNACTLHYIANDKVPVAVKLVYYFFFFFFKGVY